MESYRFKTYIYHILLGGIMIFTSCKKNDSYNANAAPSNVDALLEARYQKLLYYAVDSTTFPRSLLKESKTIKKVSSKDWTSGFFAGNLWLLFELTGNEAYKEKAVQWTTFIEKEKYNNRTHDMGFKVYNSFGNGFKITGNEAYKEVLLHSAKTLSTRFNTKVGSIRSWDFNSDIWEFPVIIDNMMNLELLFEATRISNDSSFHKLAVTHANTTLKNHFREDHSTYHVVVYDSINGMVKDKVTHQGMGDESSWARGQAWGIYGYTMAYRYTENKSYLKQAEATATFYLEHENLPEDGIPYWDFNAPKTPKTPRDVSAATIVAAAFIELFIYTNDNKYLDYANTVLRILRSNTYLLGQDVKAPFILDHSTGNYPKNDEVDEPIVYADYYFLEAILRKKKL